MEIEGALLHPGVEQRHQRAGPHDLGRLLVEGQAAEAHIRMDRVAPARLVAVQHVVGPLGAGDHGRMRGMVQVGPPD